MDDVYKRLESLVAKNGTSFAEVSRETNISKSIFSDLKSERTKKPSADYANRLAKHFGVTVNYILTGDESPNTVQQKKPTAEAEGEYYSAKKKKAIDMILNGTDEQAELVEKLYEQYLSGGK